MIKVLKYALNVWATRSNMVYWQEVNAKQSNAVMVQKTHQRYKLARQTFAVAMLTKMHYDFRYNLYRSEWIKRFPAL